jgi:hypothetical protein
MRGLIGELLFLEKQAIPSRGLREAVNGWVGPTGAQRNFRFPEHEYEIKTIRTGANRVLISSAEQLDLQTKLLDLFIVLLDEAEPASYPDAFTPLGIVGRLKESLESAPVALEAFESRLMDAGFVAREEYGERAYILRQFRIFCIREGLLRHHLWRLHFKPILRRAGLNGSLRLYDLHHSCATLLLAANENPKVISERLGHADISLTLDTYSHVLPSMQQAASEKLENLVFAKVAHNRHTR